MTFLRILGPALKSHQTSSCIILQFNRCFAHILKAQPKTLISNTQTLQLSYTHHYYQQTICYYSTDTYGLDRLRSDVEDSFSVDDTEEDQVVHGVAVSKTGKTLAFPFLNPNKNVNTVRANNEVDRKVCDLNSTQDGVKPKLPSVTKILDKTKPWYQRLILLRWEKKMIQELGKEGFAQLKKEMLSQGKIHHRNIEAVLHGIPEEDISITPDIAGYWKSIKPVLGDMGHVEFMERRIRHPVLDYGGIVDCVGKYKDQLYVIDWKTSRKPKSTLKQCYEYPLQAVAYAGALNYDPTFKHQISQALIVVAYKDGKKADVHKMSTNDCEDYWSQWLARILQYRDIMQKDDKKSKK